MDLPSTVSYWVSQKLPQIYTVIVYICIGKVVWFAVYICSNLWNTLQNLGNLKTTQNLNMGHLFELQLIRGSHNFPVLSNAGPFWNMVPPKIWHWDQLDIWDTQGFKSSASSDAYGNPNSGPQNLKVTSKSESNLIPLKIF